MNYRTLGRTGLRVSEIGFGGGGIGAVWGPTTDAEARRAVHRALDLGVNFFDVAPNYGDGRAEEVLGAALADRRASAIVATKVDLPPERADQAASFVAESFHASLRRLRTDHADLLQIHNPIFARRGLPFRDVIAVDDAFRMADAFQALRQAGKVRFLGFTAWRVGRAALDALAASGVFDTLQTEYNLLNQTASSPPPPGVAFADESTMDADGAPLVSYRYRRVNQLQAIPQAVARGMGVIAIRPVLAGVLTDALDRDAGPDPHIERLMRLAAPLASLRAGGRRTLSEAAVLFCLGNPEISTVIPGAKNVLEIEEAARCSGAAPLTQEELNTIRQAYAGGG